MGRSRRARWFGLAFVLCLSAWGSPAASAPARPKVALVLSGGGARGAAHIGVIEVLEELRVPVDIVTGTSMGSIMGGLYALGRSPAELRRVVEDTDWVAAFADDPPRSGLSYRRKQDDFNFLTRFKLGFKDGSFFIPAGAIQGQQLDYLLRRLSLTPNGVARFEDLRLPFRAVATDIVTGAPVVLEDGVLSEALRASMSIPGVFTPIERNGLRLVDGASSNNLPVDVAQALGADVVIAVGIATPEATLDNVASVLEISAKVLSHQVEKNERASIERLDSSDVLLLPNPEVGGASFTAMPEVIETGRAAALDARAALSRYSVSEAEYAIWQSKQRAPIAGTIRVSEIQIQNSSRLGDDVVASRIRTEPGEPLDLETLAADLGRIYGTDAFKSVSFDLVPGDDGMVLRFDARARARGEHSVRFGLNLDTDFTNDAVFNVAFNHVAYPLDRLGREWRTNVQVGDRIRVQSELYQPIEPSQRFFVTPGIDYDRRKLNIFDDGDRIARYVIQTGTAGLFAGVDLADFARWEVGAAYTVGDIDLDTGEAVLFEDGGHFDGATFLARFGMDTLDNTHFPRRGAVAAAKFELFRDALGWDADFETLETRWSGFVPWGANTFGLTVSYQTVFGDEDRVESLFSLGGFGNLSGFERDEIVGNHAGFARFLMYREVASPVVFSWRFPVYIGGSFEVGNAWEKRADIDDDLLLAGGAFVGAETPLGPMYLGYGYGESGNSQAYFFLGQTF
jgi:NTE family protein